MYCVNDKDGMLVHMRKKRCPLRTGFSFEAS